jgi:polysaccharide pyruvyl transferase WcaK-like protein
VINALLFNDTSYEKHHGSQLVVRQIYALAKEAGIAISRACPMRHDWRKNEQLKEDIRRADLCLINGEGTLHDDAPQALMLGELASYCRQHGVPCFLINSVWQRNEQLLAHAGDFAGIYLRDEFSQHELAAHGVACKVVPDLTLSYSHQPAAREQRTGYLVSDSVFSTRTLEAWAEVCRANRADISFLSIKNLPIIQAGKGFPDYCIKSVAKLLQAGRALLQSYFMRYPAALPSEQIGMLRWRYSALGLTRFLRRLSTSSGVVTGRFHCVTLCFVTRTPFYAIGSNTHKIQALLLEAGLPGRIQESYGAALAAREEMAFSAADRQHLEAFLLDCQRRAKDMFAEIVERARAFK